MIFARKPFKRLKSPEQYNPNKLDQQLIAVEQAMPPYGVRLVTEHTTATRADQTIVVDATGGARTVTLPLPDQAAGLVVSIVKVDASANAVTIGATVSGVVNPTLATRYKSKTVQSTGSEYITLASV